MKALANASFCVCACVLSHSDAVRHNMPSTGKRTYSVIAGGPDSRYEGRV